MLDKARIRLGEDTRGARDDTVQEGSVLTYDEWLGLSEEQRAALLRSWNPYEGEGQDLLKVACDRFRRQFEQQPGVEEIHCGVYHGGVPVIGVTAQKGSRVRVPKTFEGFPVVKMTK